ncbi:hypothetical protein ABBQ32_001202 [Trebouxia sp. C0010 RCD-2024]
MTESPAPNTAENQRTVDLSNDDQEDHRADCITPAVKKLKLAYKQFASPSSSGGRPQGRLSSIIGSALPPLLDDDSLGCY